MSKHHRDHFLNGPWTGPSYHQTKTRKPRWFWPLYFAAMAIVIALAVWAGLA